MTEQARSRGTPRPGFFDRLLVFAGLGLLIAGTAFGSRPTEQLFPPREVPLEIGEAWHDSGPCFVMLHGLDAPSDKGDSTSMMSLLEDGVPLAPHAPHRQMREGELGRFSHWGDHLYLSSTDGSDPRSNGRSYLAVLPSVLPEWAHGTMLTIVGGGALLAGLGFVLARWRRRPLWHDALPALAAAIAIASLLPLREIAQPYFALSRAEAQLFPAAREASAGAATRPGNVSRLFAGSEEAVFEPWGALPRDDERLRVALVPGADVEVVDGVARLQPGGPGLSGVIEGGLRVEGIGDVMLPARVLEGEFLELGLRVAGQSGAPKIRITVPLAPTGELRPVRIANTLALFVADDRSELSGVEIVNPASNDHDVYVELAEVVISSQASTFLHATHGSRTIERTRQIRPAHWQSVPGRYRLDIPSRPGTLLKGSVALAGRAPTQPVRWRVSWVKPDGEIEVLHADRVDGDERWHAARVEIPRVGAASRGGELLLEVDELPPGSVFAWSGWRLVDTSREPKRVILAVLDTLRRDAIGALGGVEASTPFLDELARTGVRFERAYSQAHWTRPSMPSLMTSRYVAATGVESLGHQLPERYVTLAEAFSDAGYLTLADISNTNAGPAAGLEQGWDQMRHTASPSQSDAAGQLLSAELVETIQQSVEEDLLLYIHLMDAHGPYGPAIEPGDDHAAPTGTPVPRNPAFDRDWVDEPSDVGRRHWYYRDVETLDAGLAGFFALLASRWGDEALAEATVAVTADHGEFLGEHGQWGHDWFAELPEVVNIPMLLRSPSLPRDLVVELPVENIDLGPSLLELAMISSQALGDVDGRSLLPLILEADEKDHGFALAAVGTKDDDSLIGLFTARGALLGKRGELTGTFDPSDERFVLRRSTGAPGESSMIDREFQAVLESSFADLWTRYLDVNAATREHLWADVDTSSTTIDPEALQQLEALGYLGR